MLIQHVTDMGIKSILNANLPPGGHIKSKVIKNVLGGQNLNHTADKKCSVMIFNGPRTLTGPKVLFLA